MHATLPRRRPSVLDFRIRILPELDANANAAVIEQITDESESLKRDRSMKARAEGPLEKP
jgi:hypothetical protein